MKSTTQVMCDGIRSVGSVEKDNNKNMMQQQEDGRKGQQGTNNNKSHREREVVHNCYTRSYNNGSRCPPTQTSVTERKLQVRRGDFEFTNY